MGDLLPMRWGVPTFAVTPKSCYRLVRPGDTAARCGGFIPDGGSHPSGGRGGDGRIRTSVRRVCSRVTHTRLFLPGVAERNYQSATSP